MALCAKRWCAAEATAGALCPVHAKWPKFDSRSDLAAYADGDAKPSHYRSNTPPRAPKPVPDEGFVIQLSEEEK